MQMQQMETGGMPGFRISISTAGRNIRRMLLDFFCGLLVQQKGKEQREWGTQGYLSSNGFFNGHGHRSLHKLFHDFLYRNFHCLGNDNNQSDTNETLHIIKDRTRR